MGVSIKNSKFFLLVRHGFGFRKYQRKTIIKNISIGLAAILVTLIFLEILLRVLNYPYLGCEYINPVEEETFGHFDTNLGWDYNQKVSYYRDGVVYHFDKDGFRTDSPLAEIDFSKPRMLFIGDSITFGYGLNNEDTHAFKIGQKMNDEFEIVNLGVQGYGTDQALLKLQRHIDYIQPSVIIHTFIPDHLNRNGNHDRRQYFLSECISFPGTKPLFRPTQNGPKLWRRARTTESYDRYKIIALALHGYDSLREKMWRQAGKKVDVSRQLISEIEAIGQQYQAEVYHIYYDKWFSTDPESLNPKMVRILFEDEGHRVLPFFDFAKDTDGDYFVPVSDYHPNEKVTSELADRFFEQYGSELKEIVDSFSRNDKGFILEEN